MLCLLHHYHRPGRVTWSSSSPFFISTLHFHTFQCCWGYPTSAASGTIWRLSICSCISASEPQKVRVVQIPLTVEHGLQNFAMDLLQTRRKKKSKLDSEALEWKAEIQIKCKVSRRFAGIWQYNKWQPTSGQCLSVQEDKAKSQSWIMCLGFFFFISGDVEILTFSSEVFEFQNGWSLSVIQKLGSKKKEIKRNRKALDVNCYLFKM